MLFKGFTNIDIHLRLTNTFVFITQYVGSLEDFVNEELLENAFVAFGDIVSVTIPREDNGKHRGFAFVEFKEPEDAQAAIDNMHDSELGGRVITVNLANPAAKVATSAWAQGDKWYSAEVAGSTADVDAKIRKVQGEVLQNTSQ